MAPFIKYSIGIWLILFATILPFPFYLVSPLFEIQSDAELLYWFALALLPLAMLVSGLIHLLTTEKPEKVESFLFVIIAYILAYFLLKYGFDKLLQFQFYPPEPNTLFTPLGKLTKDLLFWSAMGTSKSYNVFMGLIEIIPGILLLFRRTRLFGSLCAIAVLLNVFMINVGFDISVKLLSLYLLICSIYLIVPFLKPLFNFFFKLEAMKKIQSPKLFLTNSFVKRTLKASVLALILLDCGLPYVSQASAQSINDSNVMVGTYENQTEDLKLLNHYVKRLHIHSKGYFIIEDTNGNFFDYPCVISGQNERIHLTDIGLTIFIGIKNNGTLFSWEKNNLIITMVTHKIGLEELPLKNDSFHWTVEGMIGK